ncbi:MAG TPA: HAD-IA family hydrolase [Candidatus Nanopelagicaceae bacterium]|nr:HAD-IA family hydrolase [Candidatus Nanopelagicaceae bacterium]
MTRKIPFSFTGKKVIVFDLDGTIVRLAADWHSLLKALTSRFTEKYREIINYSSMSAILSRIVEKGDEEELQLNFNLIQQYELENITRNEPIKETLFFINNKELFGVFHNAKLAVFSLNTRSTILKSLEMAGILDEIEFFVGREDVRKWKPEPAGLLKILGHFKVNTEEMIYFGDLEVDLLAGANAGVESYHIDTLINHVRKIKKVSQP